MKRRYLARASKEKKYKKVIEKMYDTLKDTPTDKGMLSIFLNPNTGKHDGQTFSMGASSDSYYEYLLKMWIQSGKKDKVPSLFSLFFFIL